LPTGVGMSSTALQVISRTQQILPGEGIPGGGRGAEHAGVGAQGCLLHLGEVPVLHPYWRKLSFTEVPRSREFSEVCIAPAQHLCAYRAQIGRLRILSRLP
jgi:hypothetical protein